jgi:protein-disulfide isomerase
MAMLNRRQFVATLSGAAMTEAAALSAADQATQWFPITADDGKPVPNMRAPVELAAEVDDLGGVIWTGSQSSGPTLVEFFDYNCPYCRKAAGDLHACYGKYPSCGSAW